MMRETRYIMFFLCLGCLSKAQQQGLFTNFLLNQAVYNPAYIGSVSGKQFNLGYRDQWSGFEGAPRSAVFTGYGNFRKKQHLAVGASILSEKIGLIDFTSGYGIGSYRLKINKKAAISFAIGAGGVQYNAKTYNARTYDKDDQYVTSGLVSSLCFDANAGLYFYTKDMFVGFSTQHLTNSKIQWTNSEGHLTPHYYTYAGYNFYVDKKKEWCLQPSILLRSSPPVKTQLEINLKAIYRDLVWIGGNYRDKASAGFSAGFLISKQFMCAYAYDYIISDLSNYAGGSNEIQISYQIPLSKRKSKSEQIQDADEQELNTIDNTIKTTIKGKKEDEGAPKTEPENKEKPKRE